MKRVQIVLTVIFYVHSISLAQMPTNKINYQGIARSVNGTPLSSRSVRLKLDVSDSNGSVIHYSEVHQIVTSAQGLFNIQIGSGSILNGKYDSIPWSAGRTFLRTHIDTSGSGNFSIIGLSEFATVPYALFSLYGSVDATSVQVPVRQIIDQSINEKRGFGMGFRALDKLGSKVVNSDNIAIGSYAGYLIPTTQSMFNSNDNLLIGLNSGMGLGSQNAGQSSNNVFLGNYSGQYINPNASGSVLVGSGSGRFSGGSFNGRSSFGSNVAVGVNTLSYASDATFNVAIGSRNMQSSKSGHRNVSIGSNASLSYRGDDNVLIGEGMTDDTTSMGNRNVIIGASSGRKYIGDLSVIIGYQAGRDAYLTNPSSPLGLVAVGPYAGAKTLIGANTFLGNQSGSENTSGTDNTFVGQISGGNNTRGSYNSYYGMFSGLYNRSGNNNDYFGTRAGMNQSSGNSNAIFGNFSGDLDSTGTFNGNSIFGVHAGRNVRNGMNVIMGHNAAAFAQIGTGNIILGANAGPAGTTAQSTQNYRLYIDVEQSNTPLIYGEFDNNKVVINGDLSVSGKISGVSTKKIRYGSNLNANLLLEDDVEVFYCANGLWNPSINLPVPSTSNQMLYNRIGTNLLITCKSTISVTIKKDNTDLATDLTLNANEYALFIYDATMWRKVAGK